MATLPEGWEERDSVGLPGGWDVPDRFEQHTAVIVDDQAVGVAAVVVRMRDGRPQPERLELKFFDQAGNWGSIAPKHLPQINLVEILDLAVTAEALDQMDWHGADRERDYWSDAHGAAQRARWRRTTPDRLQEVLDQYAEGGINKVTDEQHISERHARRLLARARKELQ
jgi:hypothetical protein